MHNDHSKNTLAERPVTADGWSRQGNGDSAYREEMARVTDPETHPAGMGLFKNCDGETIPADLHGEALLHSTLTRPRNQWDGSGAVELSNPGIRFSGGFFPANHQ